jgi:hypothetical protein
MNNQKQTQSERRMETIKKEYKMDKQFFGGKTAYELCREIEIKGGMTEDGQMVKWVESRTYKINDK